MTYKMIKHYLSEGYIVKNEEYEYKFSHSKLYCRKLGTIPWNIQSHILKNELSQSWKIVGKK